MKLNLKSCNIFLRNHSIDKQLNRKEEKSKENSIFLFQEDAQRKEPASRQPADLDDERRRLVEVSLSLSRVDSS